MYEKFKEFSSKIDNLLIDLAFNNIVSEETEEIIELQKDTIFKDNGYGFYKLNEHQAEDFLK